MKRLRISRCSGQLLQSRLGAPAHTSFLQIPTSSSRAIPPVSSTIIRLSSSGTTPVEQTHLESDIVPDVASLPSTPPAAALHSPKLAALHARLSLSSKVPLQTLARALVHPSADANAAFNNASLSFLGSTIVNYHVLEYVVCRWPRLPMAILYETLRAYAGKESLHQVAKRWGTESAAAPGGEVDSGLLQWRVSAGQEPPSLTTRWGHIRSAGERTGGHRVGTSSKVVNDDPFGDMIRAETLTEQAKYELGQDRAFESFVHAVVGAIQMHSGRQAAKDFVKSHILSRQFDPATLFAFRLPTKEVAMLCAREGFEAPIARLESETGRRSRTPVFVVGVYSGKEKLGEGAGSSLDMARKVASMNALKAWYLYSPGNKVRVPSDMLEEGAKPWKAPHIDIGEII